MDWEQWHHAYDDASSKRYLRLKVVQDRIRTWLDEAPDGPLKVVSICAGQGRDLLPVLATHARAEDVSARLVETDPRNIEVGQAVATPAHVEYTRQDAGLAASYVGMVPADLVLVAGVLGNLRPDDAERTVEACAAWCKVGGVVIWTRHRENPDPVPAICDGFERRGLHRMFLTEPEMAFTVGVHRQIRPPNPVTFERVFTFVGSDVLRRR